MANSKAETERSHLMLRDRLKQVDDELTKIKTQLEKVLRERYLHFFKWQHMVYFFFQFRARFLKISWKKLSNRNIFVNRSQLDNKLAAANDHNDVLRKRADVQEKAMKRGEWWVDIFQYFLSLKDKVSILNTKNTPFFCKMQEARIYLGVKNWLAEISIRNFNEYQPKNSAEKVPY